MKKYTRYRSYIAIHHAERLPRLFFLQNWQFAVFVVTKIKTQKSVNRKPEKCFDCGDGRGEPLPLGIAQHHLSIWRSRETGNRRRSGHREGGGETRRDQRKFLSPYAPRVGEPKDNPSRRRQPPVVVIKKKKERVRQSE